MSTAPSPRPPQVLVLLDRSNVDIYLRLTALPAPGEKVLVEHTWEEPGGVSGNFAAHVASLGARTSVVGSATHDTAARADLDDLRARGVDVVVDQDSAGPAFRCYILLSPDGERSILIAPPPDLQRMSAGIARAMARVEAGSDLMYLGVWNDGLVPLLPQCAARARRLAVTLENSAWPAQETSFPAAAFTFVFCADETYDAHSDTVDRWQERGGFTLVVTRGSAGATHRVPGEAWTAVAAASSSQPVVDTSGAGDCFAAAYCYGHLTGVRGTDLLTYAAAQARAAIAHTGPRPPRS